MDAIKRNKIKKKKYCSNLQLPAGQVRLTQVLSE